jgi:CRP-like cAMP-binding protein
MAIEETLKRIQLMKYLNPEELRLFEGKLDRREYATGTVVFKERTPGDEMLLITKGAVEISIERNNAKLVLADLPENSFFGEMALITERPRSATATTRSTCELYALSRARFRELLEEQPKLAVRFLLALSEILCGRILSTNENLETYFLINKAIVDNEQFRKLYIHSHAKPE